MAAALRELEEETGLTVHPKSLVARGCINSEKEDVSSVHAGAFFRVDLAELGMDHASIAERVTGQAEPHRVEWISATALGVDTLAPHGGEWEDWSKIVFAGLGESAKVMIQESS